MSEKGSGLTAGVAVGVHLNVDVLGAVMLGYIALWFVAVIAVGVRIWGRPL